MPVLIQGTMAVSTTFCTSIPLCPFCPQETRRIMAAIPQGEVINSSEAALSARVALRGSAGHASSDAGQQGLLKCLSAPQDFLRISSLVPQVYFPAEMV